MAEKNLTTRIKHKIDTSANWAKAVNFIPLKGEIIIYSDLRKIKVGDGVTKVNSLQFLAESTVNNGKLTIQKNGTTVATFTANQSGNATANITVPTKTSELTNDSFVTTSTTQNIDGNKIFRGDYTYLETDTIRLGKVVYDRRNVGDAPQTLSFMDSGRTTSGYYGAVIYAGAGDWLYCAHAKDNFDIKASYRGDGSENDTYDPNLGYTHKWLNNLTDWKYTSGWHVFASKITSATPAIIQIKFTTKLYTDVLRLILTGHCLKDPSGDYSGFLDDYTIEVCTDYENDTWVTVVNRTNANDNIGRGLIYGLQLDTYTKCYGIRLKVTKCHVTGRGYQFINITTMQLRDYRPALTVPESVGAVSQLGGDVWGKLITHDNLETGHVFPHKDNYYNLGSSTNRYQGIFGMVFYENGTALPNKYLGKTAKAADSAKLNGQPSSHYLTSIKMNGTTHTSTNSTVDLGTVITDTTDLVPYTGATKDVNIGNHGILMGEPTGTLLTLDPGTIMFSLGGESQDMLYIDARTVTISNDNAGDSIYWPGAIGSTAAGAKVFALTSDITSHAGIDKVGTVTSVNGISPDSNGNVNISSDWEFLGKIAEKTFSKAFTEVKPGKSGIPSGNATVNVTATTYQKKIEGAIVGYKTIVDVTCRCEQFNLNDVGFKVLLSTVGSRWFMPRIAIAKGNMNSTAFNTMMDKLNQQKDNVGIAIEDVAIFKDNRGVSGNPGTLNVSGVTSAQVVYDASEFRLFAVMIELDKDNEGKAIPCTGVHYRIVLYHPQTILS